MRRRRAAHGGAQERHIDVNLATLKPEQFKGAETRDISFKAGTREFNMKGAPYLETWAKANFFFHVTTAYNILRHNGVELGKPDYLSGGA